MGNGFLYWIIGYFSCMFVLKVGHFSYFYSISIQDIFPVKFRQASVLYHFSCLVLTGRFYSPYIWTASNFSCHVLMSFLLSCFDSQRFHVMAAQYCNVTQLVLSWRNFSSLFILVALYYTSLWIKNSLFLFKNICNSANI